MQRSYSRESGVVSIFTVLFFMIFISIITVGFIKIVGDEEVQSINNDLSASALAAANSGVEDGKRILAYCRAASSNCSTFLNSTSCSSVTGTVQGRSVLDDLDIDYNTATNEGIVSKQSDYLQRWSCMILTTNTRDVILSVPEDQSVLVPLDSTTGNFNTINIQWHDTNSTDGKPTAYPASTTPQNRPDWLYSNFPAGIRVQLITHTNGAINIATLDNNTHAITLYPSTVTIPVTYDIAALDQRQTADPMLKTSRTPFAGSCKTISASMTGYACSANLSLSPPATNGNKYYLRISSIYRDTHVALSLNNGAVLFDNVQPTVDVTGRTNDVFRRVKAQVDFTGDFNIPNFALQSGQEVCKNMLVTDQNATSSDNCLPYPAP